MAGRPDVPYEARSLGNNPNSAAFGEQLDGPHSHLLSEYGQGDYEDETSVGGKNGMTFWFS